MNQRYAVDPDQGSTIITGTFRLGANRQIGCGDSSAGWVARRAWLFRLRECPVNGNGAPSSAMLNSPADEGEERNNEREKARGS
jgi:hypothetical protein